MNMMKSRRVVMVCLVVALLTCQVLQSMVLVSAVDAVTVTVSNLSALHTAINNAEDGDVIGIAGVITVNNETVIGKPDKHVTLLRTAANAYFNLETAYNSSLIQNITFDGGGISSTHPYLKVNISTNFENVTFINCISTSNGGAVSITDGEVNFNSCLFESNTGLNGGHFAVSGGVVNVNNSILKSGYATEKGGAIFNGSPGSTCHIT